MITFMLYLFVALITIFLMEGVAWFTHKYIMHGPLWFLHRDHHKKDHNSFFERNDFFFLIFAVPGIVLLYIGTTQAAYFLVSIGAGVTIYGMLYFMVHDIFIHQRFDLFKNTRHPYLKAIRKAHKMHHKHLDKHDGECFGMLLVPIKYIREQKKSISG